MIIHTEENPYTCICLGKDFLHKAHLKPNLGTHYKEKPHQCSYCDKAFSQKNIKRHSRTHTGEKL